MIIHMRVLFLLFVRIACRQRSISVRYRRFNPFLAFHKQRVLEVLNAEKGGGHAGSYARPCGPSDERQGDGSSPDTCGYVLLS